MFFPRLSNVAVRVQSCVVPSPLSANSGVFIVSSSWGSLWALLGSPGASRGTSGAGFGHLLGRLWASLGLLGRLWGPWAGHWGLRAPPGETLGRLRGSLGGFGGLWAPPGSPLVRSGGLFGVPGCRTGRPRTPRDAPGSRQIAAGSTRERSRAPRDRPRPPETALPQSGFRSVQNAPGRF